MFIWLILTISIEIPAESGAGSAEIIWIVFVEESADFGIVKSCLQIVEIKIAVVNVSVLSAVSVYVFQCDKIRS